MRAGSKKMVTGALFSKETLGERIEKDIGHANSHAPFHIPMGHEAKLTAAVLQVNHLYVEPALEETIVTEIEIGKPASAFANQEAVGKEQLPKTFGKTVT